MHLPPNLLPLLLLLPLSLCSPLHLHQQTVASNDQPRIWPLPAQATWGSSKVTVSTSLSLDLTDAPAEIHETLKDTFGHLIDVTFTHTPDTTYTGQLQSVRVQVSSNDLSLQLYTDETYTLEVTEDGKAQITAKTVYGGLAGLQTLFQLILFDFTASQYYVANAPWSINDRPRFPHRGVLIDTSRHYLPPPVLRKVIDSLSYAKFNVIHWHLTDAQAVPLQSLAEPKMADGAWSENERYTLSDLTHLVECARRRGIKVMMEVDVPGHEESWCKGRPDLCPRPDCRMPLDPSTNATWTFLENIFRELTGGIRGKGMFPYDLFHLGGDEVNTNCWQTTPRIMEWGQKHGLNNAQDIYLDFIKRSQDLAVKMGRDPVGWEEIWTNFGTKLPKNTIVHMWFENKRTNEIVTAGYRLLRSTNWYLDHENEKWTDYYAINPTDGITDPTRKSLVLGGEACMWGERVDPSVIHSVIWPRAAAVSERLWSAEGVNDSNAALPRYRWFRCLLLSRGIGAGVVNAPGGNRPGAPGSCDQIQN